MAFDPNDNSDLESAVLNEPVDELGLAAPRGLPSLGKFDPDDDSDIEDILTKESTEQLKENLGMISVGIPGTSLVTSFDLGKTLESIGKAADEQFATELADDFKDAGLKMSAFTVGAGYGMTDIYRGVNQIANNEYFMDDAVARKRLLDDAATFKLIENDPTFGTWGTLGWVAGLIAEPVGFALGGSSKLLKAASGAGAMFKGGAVGATFSGLGFVEEGNNRFYQAMYGAGFGAAMMGVFHKVAAASAIRRHGKVLNKAGYVEHEMGNLIESPGQGQFLRTLTMDDESAKVIESWSERGLEHLLEPRSVNTRIRSFGKVTDHFTDVKEIQDVMKNMAHEFEGLRFNEQVIGDDALAVLAGIHLRNGVDPVKYLKQFQGFTPKLVSSLVLTLNYAGKFQRSAARYVNAKKGIGKLKEGESLDDLFLEAANYAADLEAISRVAGFGRSEAGRALRAIGQTNKIHNILMDTNVQDALEKVGFSIESMEELMEAAAKANSIYTLGRITKVIGGVTRGDKYSYFMLASILSNPTTHLVNVAMNAAMPLVHLIDKTTGKLIHQVTFGMSDKAALALGRAGRFLLNKSFDPDAPVATKDIITWREIGRQAQGYVEGLKAGVPMALKILKGKVSFEDSLKLDQGNRALLESVLKSDIQQGASMVFGDTIGKPLGSLVHGLVSLPGRGLMSADRIFRDMSTFAHAHALAERQAYAYAKEHGLKIGTEAYNKLHSAFFESSLYKRTLHEKLLSDAPLTTQTTFSPYMLRERIRDLATQGGMDRKSKAFKELDERLLGKDDYFTKRITSMAGRATFTEDLGQLGKMIQTASNKSVFAKALMPFVRTPINLMKEGVDRTPGLNLVFSMSPGLRQRMVGELAHIESAGTRIEAVGRYVASTIFTGLAWQMATNGYITGHGPVNKHMRDERDILGVPPNSFHVGRLFRDKFGMEPSDVGLEEWYSYSRADPFGMVLGAISDVAEVYHYNIDPRNDDLASAAMEFAVTGIMHNLVNKTYMSTMSDMLEVWYAPNVDASRFGETIGKYMNTLLAPIGLATGGTGPGSFPLAASIHRQFDRTRRSTKADKTSITVGDALGEGAPFSDVYLGPVIAQGLEGMRKAMLKNSPIWAKDLYPQRNLFGEIDVYGGTDALRETYVAKMLNFFNPLYSYTRKTSPAAVAIQNANIDVRKPQRVIGKYKLNDEQYDYYQVRAGAHLKEWLNHVVTTDDMSTVNWEMPGLRGVTLNNIPLKHRDKHFMELPRFLQEKLVRNMVNLSRQTARFEVMDKFGITLPVYEHNIQEKYK